MAEAEPKSTAEPTSERTPRKVLPVVWNNLVSWVNRNGGQVHADLELRDAASGLRGVFASKPIQKGETLIRLPVNLSVHGQDLPDEFRIPSGEDATAEKDTVNGSVSGRTSNARKASPWLRCLAAYLRLDTTSAANHHHPYLASLPRQYETLWHWSDDETTIFLAGTRPPATTTSSEGWKIDRAALRNRYGQQIRPYLVHCAIVADGAEHAFEETEFQQFAKACQVLSTRGFHMEPPSTKECNASTIDHVDPSLASSYSGPFLLPVMDLLNHASKTTGRTCTTLQREQQQQQQQFDGGASFFVMVAERHVAAGEEILHSYGDSLSSSQFLASFGFVPRDRMQRAVENNCNTPPPPTTPILLSKTDDVWKTCWQVIESDFPEKLTSLMREQDTDDEVWSLQADRSRRADYVAEEILISAATAGDNGNHTEVQQLDLLTDELVTALCVPLLPRCAYSEITERTLLDRSILEDFFLGKLVAAVLLKVVERKLSRYAPIPNKVVQHFLGNDGNGVSVDDDRALLQALCSAALCEGDDFETIRRQSQRLAYGLTVRIEEKNTLEALRRQAVELMMILDGSNAAADDETSFKKQKNS